SARFHPLFAATPVILLIGTEEFQSLGDFRPDRDNIRRLGVPLLYRNLLTAILKCPEEIWIFPSDIFHFVPTEDLVVAGHNPSHQIVPKLIRGCFLYWTRLIGVRLIPLQKQRHASHRKVILVGDVSFT